ncbi:MAG TPA: heavy-metal-associated domain-containing protein [Terriglobales bacterium]|nr:heavy-metal-associated domain-containing protein [Terriglobales bacterium]
MTAVDVCYRYGTPPGELELRALNSAREIYGVRKITFDEKDRTVRVEYDATRLDAKEIANILRRSGLDLRERVQLV